MRRLLHPLGQDGARTWLNPPTLRIRPPINGSMPLIPDIGLPRFLLRSAAYCAVGAGRLPLGFGTFGLAFGDLPGGAGVDITAGWRQTERVDVAGWC